MDKKMWSEVIFVAMGAIATVVYTFYTIQLVRVTEEYTKATKEYTEITRTSFEAMNRPYIFLENPKISEAIEPGFGFGDSKVKALYVTLENYGSVPAYDIEITSIIRIHGIGINTKLDLLEENYPPSAIFPKQKYTIPFVIRDEIYSYLDKNRIGHFDININYKGIKESKYLTEQKFQTLGLKYGNVLNPIGGKHK